MGSISKQHTCLPNSTYNTYGLAFPTTCDIPNVLPNCAATITCVDICMCHEGLVLVARTSIPPSECGCIFWGLFHGIGEEFWDDLTCTQRCVCDVDQQQAVCQDSGCGTEKECWMEVGIQECYPNIFGVRTAVGATHYKTFEGRRFIFQETCIPVGWVGQDAVVESNFGLIVTYDWHSHVTATMPSGFANALCGVCRNYNGTASDDMMMRNTHVTSDPDAFRSS